MAKIKLYGGLNKILNILKNIYEDIELRVAIGKGKMSKRFKAHKGVRQGCQLSPLLFSLFINALIKFYANIDTHAPCINGRDVKPLFLRHRLKTE